MCVMKQNDVIKILKAPTNLIQFHGFFKQLWNEEAVDPPSGLK